MVGSTCGNFITFVSMGFSSINGNSQQAWWQVRKLAYFIHNLLRHAIITKESSGGGSCLHLKAWYPKYHHSASTWIVFREIVVFSNEKLDQIRMKYISFTLIWHNYCKIFDVTIFTQRFISLSRLCLLMGDC